MATNKTSKSVKKAPSKPAAGLAGTQAKYPRHSIERALRIPKAILEQNAGRSCTPTEAAGYLGVGFGGPFKVEVSSALKYGFLTRPESGKIQLTDLSRSILRPTNSEEVLRGYRTAVMNAPDISAVYSHYRGENIPDETFFNNALVDTFRIPEGDLGDFKAVFFESLETAKLIERRDDKIRVLDVSTEVPATPSSESRVKKLANAADIKTGETCFVMQPFATPHGDYYEKIFKPAIEKTGLRPIRADADIFGTGKIIDQIWRGINSAKVLVAELTTRNANVLYELGIAHALRKPVVLVSSNQPDVPFDLKHIRVIYYDVTDPFWGTKLIEKVAENIISAINNPEEATFKAVDEVGV
jgi:hypothetical protein